MILLVVIIIIGIKNPAILSPVVLNSTHCTPAPETLPDLSFQDCCNNFNQLTSNKYLASLNVVVALKAEPYLDICSAFCSQGFDKTNQTCLGNVESDNIQFTNCVNASKNVGCTDPSTPVAISQGNYLYVNSAGSVLCQQTSPCSLVI